MKLNDLFENYYKDLLIRAQDGDREAQRTLRKLQQPERKENPNNKYYIGLFIPSHRTCFYGDTVAVSTKQALNNFNHRLKRHFIERRWMFEGDYKKDMRVFTDKVGLEKFLSRFQQTYLIK